MPKLIRPTYPAQFSIALLFLIFIISSLLSYQVFTVPFLDLDKNKSIYFGMFLVGAAVIIMLLIIWEEFLFPIKVKEINGGVIYSNHRTKLKTQLLIYCSIPSIFIFIYFEYEVNLFRFIICAAVCTIAPLVEKIASGINNYNDFLKLTLHAIEYKDNKKVGSYKIQDIQKIAIIRGERNSIKKIQLYTGSNNVTVDLDKMELDAFFDSIYKYMVTNYKDLLEERKEAESIQK